MFPLLKKKSSFFPTPTTCLSIRCMEEKDLELVMNWCKGEKWNVGKYDVPAYYALDPKGHFLFLLDKQPVGAISIVRYSAQLFAIGPFIVKNEYRNKGYGAKIWQHAMKLLENNNDATACLYSVPAQISRYANSGFKKNFHIQRWQKNLINNLTSDIEKKTEELKRLDTVSIESVIDYDQSIFSVSRKKLLTTLMQCQNIVGFASTDDTGKVTGFGLIRPCIKGYRIGPLYADHIENAQKLFRTLLARVNNCTVFIDAPSHNPYIELFTSYFNLARVSEADTVAMFRGEVPASLIENNHKNYAVCSLEIG
jgi:ribosomal protein S18 acetylase RimI-like enzyme